MLPATIALCADGSGNIEIQNESPSFIGAQTARIHESDRFGKWKPCAGSQS